MDIFTGFLAFYFIDDILFARFKKRNAVSKIKII